MSDLRIHAALSPRVAVLSSPDVDRVIQLNNIPDLATLLRPFEFSVERLSVRTSQLETRICDRFPLRFDPYSLFNPDAARSISSSSSQPLPRPSAVGRSNEELLDQVNQLIGANIKRWDASVPRPAATSTSPVTAADDVEEGEEKEKELDEALLKLQKGSIDEVTPWFAAVQNLVFGQRTIAKHESFGYPVAVLLAVSSASPDPMNDFAKLYEASSHPHPFPGHPYINPDTLKYYVLIHDVRSSGTDLASSKETLEQIKKTYGLHCCLLPINSAEEGRGVMEGLSNLWGPYVEGEVGKVLDNEDVKRIKGFIRELTAQSIVPFMERYVQHMGEHLANSRKGLTNRLFGASRKLFGSSSTPSTGLATAGGYDPAQEFYPYSSIESQTRRLADFAFTIRDYKLAASMYDLCRRDFANDKAHKHSAGAGEMFGLSHLLIMFTQRTPPIDVDSYLSQAVHDYSLSPSSYTSALRATLLYYEAYRLLSYLRPAPSGLLRMAGRSDEVLSPLLLEQAALSYLKLPKPALRKFALHLVGAGEKYQSCGQKVLSLRCYANAARVYGGVGWTEVENHIERELGWQAYNEGNSDGAVEHLIRLIRPSTNSSAEHKEFLEAVGMAYKYSEGRELRLGVEVFDSANATLSFAGESGAEGSGVEKEVWENLEKELVERGLGERILEDGTKVKRKPPKSLSSNQAKEVGVNQTFYLDLTLRNPLSIDLVVDSISPVLISNSEPFDAFNTDPPQAVILGPFEVRPIRIPIRVLTPANLLRVSGLTFRLAQSILLTQPLSKRGARLNKTKDQRTSISYAPDLTLAVSVHAARPTLSAKILDAPREMYLGEERRLKVVVRNGGKGRVEDIRSLSNQADSATFTSSSDAGGGMENSLKPSLPQPLCSALAPGEEIELDLILRPTRLGGVRLAWLLSFESGGETYLSHLSASVHVSPAVEVRVTTKPARMRECKFELMVEVKNLLSEEVRLDAISVLSPSYKILSEGRDREIKVEPRQTWRGRLVIESPESERAGEGGEVWTALKLQDLLLSRDTKRSGPPEVKLDVSTHSYSSPDPSANLALHGEARKLWRMKTLSSSFPTISSRDRVASFTLWERGSLDLLTHFSVGSRTGSIAVYGLHPGPLRSSIRSITHPLTTQTGQIRSLYSETIKEKASLLSNILTSPLGREQCPTVVFVEKAEEGCFRWVVRNFSDKYKVRVEVRAEGEGWIGRKGGRVELERGESGVVEGRRRDEGGKGEGGLRYTVTTETFLTMDGKDGVGVGRYVEHY